MPDWLLVQMPGQDMADWIEQIDDLGLGMVVYLRPITCIRAAGDEAI